MLRPSPYNAVLRRKGKPLAALAFAAALAGCTMSGGKDAAPVATGSIGPAVQVEGPLPQTLAYSDAAMIGKAATASAPSSTGEFEWINAATGSSGTLQDLPAPAPVAAEDPSRACKLFNTIVTSFSGVHKYNGRLCSRSDGQRTISIDPPSAEASPPEATQAAFQSAAPQSTPPQVTQPDRSDAQSAAGGPVPLLPAGSAAPSAAPAA